MSKPPDAIEYGMPPLPNQSDPIEKYLDRVCRYLQMMPEDDVAEIRRELREHLELSTAELVSSGMTDDDAPREAIRRFGKAKDVGLDIAMKSAYAWMWRVTSKGDISMTSSIDRLTRFVYFLPSVILVSIIVAKQISNASPDNTPWLVVVSFGFYLLSGAGNAASFIVTHAVGNDFNQMSRRIAVALRMIDDSKMPSWRRKLKMHRVYAALRIALDHVQTRDIRSRVTILAILDGLIMLPYCIFVYHDTVTAGHRYSALMLPASFMGQPIGEMIVLACIWFRRKSMVVSGDVDHC